jgi:hypothetical protein
MLAKCTNPSCSASFRHLDEGRLFLLETDPIFGSSKAKTTEYFWLCKDCSAGMTLRLTQEGRVMPGELPEALRNEPQVAFVSVNRENGLLLRGVSFLRSNTSREAHQNPIEARAIPHILEQHDDIVAAASICPLPDCSSLVIEYRAASAIRPGHPEDWEFTCSRCGLEFTVAHGELIFQSVPKQWLSSNVHFV